MDLAAPAPLNAGRFNDAARDTPRPDDAILSIVAVLMALGVVMVCSASVTVTTPLELRSLWGAPLRQGLFAVAGLVAAVFMSRVGYGLFAWRREGEGWWAGGLFLAAALLLLAVLVPGVGLARLGAQRALVVMTTPMTLSFQPSELAKFALVIWLAALLTRPGFDVRSFRTGYVPAIASAGLLIGLTGLEDFGTAALMGVLTAALLFAAGARWLHLIATALLGLGAGALLILVRPYRLERLATFFTDNPDPSGAGYQVTQSLIAIGSGGWFGNGLGAGVQKYGYLPQDNNDFIFAIVCEELGAAGGLAIIALFLLLLWRGWRMCALAAEPMGRLIAFGVTLLLCLQAAFNIGVVTNSLPTKGISLPFVSAGGSGVLFLGMAAGLLASVAPPPRRREAAGSEGRGREAEALLPGFATRAR